MFVRVIPAYLSCLALLMGTACETEKIDASNNQPNIRPLSAREAQTVSNSNTFAFRAYSRISETEGDKNVCISPLSISAAIAMTYNGAGSTTKESISQTMGFSPMTEQEVNESFKSLNTLLSGIDKKVDLSIANSIWHKDEFTLQPGFAALNKNYFDAEVRGLNFMDPTSPTIINNWVKEKTKGKIEDIVERIQPDHLMFLINAIYFKGVWSSQFDKKLTLDAPFYLSDGSTVTAKTIVLKNSPYLLHQDNLKTLVDLPFGNKQFSMTLIIPENKNLQDFEKQLTVDNLNTWVSEAKNATLDLYMPSFKLNYEIQLIETLSAMGMAEAFSPQADFSRMLEGISGGIAISDVKHKTFIEVNEEGAEAAAVTSVEIAGRSSLALASPPAIYYNRPFIFMIREKSSNTILFIGKLVNPA